MAPAIGLSETFQCLRTQHRAAFIPFFAAGDPDIATTGELIKGAAAQGADIIEVGVPFSDPIADGPVIQAAFYRALDSGFRVAQVFEMAKNLRAGGLTTPLVCMVSYTLVYKKTLPEFCRACRESGFNGLIMPDLPAGYEGDAAAQAAAAGVDLIFLAAPTTTPERREIILQRSRGFIYYISVAGITGARTALPADLAANVNELKRRTQTPVCVGFGVSRPEQAAEVAKFADGVIVGSALVKRVDEARGKGLRGPALVDYVSQSVREFAQAAHGAR